MKKVYLLALATAFAFTACKDNKAETPTTEAPATETTADHTDHTGHDHGTETTTPATEGTVSTTAEGVKLNPAHGQPGHRCEIAVGAPLDGSATPNQAAQPQAQPAANNGKGFLGGGNTSAPSAPAQQVQAQPQQAAPAQQTVAGMQGKPNPAHGQPGHRCDVQVGQPLP